MNAQDDLLFRCIVSTAHIFVECDVRRVGAVSRTCPTSCNVNNDRSHGRRRIRKKVSAVGRIQPLGLAKLQVALVDECRRPKIGVGKTTTQTCMRDPPQIGVDRFEEPVQCASIASAGVLNQLSDVAHVSVVVWSKRDVAFACVAS